jgi:hypothetical protein
MIKVVNEYTHIKSIYNFSGNIDGTNLIKYNSNLNPINKEQLLNYLKKLNLLNNNIYEK